ncbi:heme-binding protein [Pseudorhodobacter sp.]|nr:heme-binding protein [Pseudorhodobacter sp.]
MTGLAGGLPIFVAGRLVGGVGVGSGSGIQDIEVAEAMLAAIGADPA